MELEQELNKLLANLNIFYIKIQNYHWNIQGKDFFVVHAKLEEYYDEIQEQIDEIAEHILILGGQPLGTIKDYINNGNIAEAENKKIKSEEIFNNILEDIKVLLSIITKIKENADSLKEYSTSALMDKYIESYSKKMWMLKQSQQ